MCEYLLKSEFLALYFQVFRLVNDIYSRMQNMVVSHVLMGATMIWKEKPDRVGVSNHVITMHGV
jgi:hypothetical protein